MNAPLKLLLLLASACAARAQALDESELRRKLGADNAAAREQASREIFGRRLDLTAADLKVLERLSTDADTEVAARSRDLLKAARRIQLMTPELRTLTSGIRGRGEQAEVQSSDIRTVACLWGAGDLDDAQVYGWFEELADLPWVPPDFDEIDLIANFGATPFGRRVARFVEEMDGDVCFPERAAAALAAARCADETSTLSRLLDAKWPGTPIAALKAIGRLRAASLRERVLEFTASPVPGIRAAAAEAIGEIADRRDLELLRDLARDADARVRAAAATALPNFRNAAPVSILEAMLDDTDSDCVLAAAGALAKLGAKDSAVKIASHCARFTDDWFQFQDALIALDNDHAIPILLDIAERESGKVAETALAGVWKLRNAADATRLLALLDEPGRSRRLHVVWTLDQTRPEGFEDRIIALLSDDDPEVRAYAADVCQRDLIRRAVPQLRNLLHSTKPGLRSQALSALADLGMQEIGPALRTQLASPFQSERNDAVFKIGIVAYRPAVVELQQLLQSPRSDERGWAALALGSCPDPSSRQPLLAMRSDNSPVVRFRAVEALIELGHVDDVREWVLSTPPNEWAFVTAPRNLVRRANRGWALEAWFNSLRSSRWPTVWRTLANLDAAQGGDWPESLESAHVNRLQTLAARGGTNVSRGARVELIKRGLIPRSEWRAILETEANINSLWWGQKEVYRAFGMAEYPLTANKLRGPEVLTEDIANEDDFARFLKSRGVEFEAGPFRIKGRFSAGREVTPLEIIHLTEMNINDFAVVIEKDRVRGMRTRDAAAYWREKLPR